MRYRLRSLLLIITIVGVALGWWIDHVTKKRDAIRALNALNSGRAVVQYSSGSGGLTSARPTIPPWLTWLGDALGEECFGEVVKVNLDSTAVTDEDLNNLKRLPSVTDLWLRGTPGITDEGLSTVASCANLRSLYISGSSVSDRGLAHLTSLLNLEELSLQRTQVTDEGLSKYVAKLKALKCVRLQDTAVTQTGCNELQAALPYCEIQSDVFWRLPKERSPNPTSFAGRIVEARTGKRIPGKGFTIQFLFRLAATADSPEVVVDNMFWGPNAIGEFRFLVPDRSLKHPQRDRIDVVCAVSHAGYEAYRSNPVKLDELIDDDPESARDTFRFVRLVPKSE